MRTNKALSFLAPALVAVLLATAAGGRSVTRATAPAPWAKQVCSALGSWLDALDRAAETAAGDGGDAIAAKKALTKMLKNARKATATAQGKLLKAGAPKSPNGKQIASFVKETYAQVLRSITQAQKAVARAKATDPVAFVTAARSAQDAVEASLESQQAALRSATDADDPKLVAAFAEESACTRPVENEATPGVTVDPAEAAPGTAVSITPSGVDAAAVETCLSSSAFATELLADDGTRLATGSEAVDVPATATAGRAWVRLVCYLPDATGRRVIHGLCAPLGITGEGAQPVDRPPTDASCPPAPRIVLSQAIVAASAALELGLQPGPLATRGLSHRGTGIPAPPGRMTRWKRRASSCSLSWRVRSPSRTCSRAGSAASTSATPTRARSRAPSSTASPASPRSQSPASSTSARAHSARCSRAAVVPRSRASRAASRSRVTTGRPS